MRLSPKATGMIRKQAAFPWKTVRAVWHHAGARVARLRCPILRHGGATIPRPAGGRKALNARNIKGTSLKCSTNFSR